MRKSNIESIQFNTTDLQLITQLSQIKPSQSDYHNIKSISSHNSNNIDNISICDNKIKNSLLEDQNKDLIFERIEKFRDQHNKTVPHRLELKPQNFDKIENKYHQSLESFDDSSELILQKSSQKHQAPSQSKQTQQKQYEQDQLINRHGESPSFATKSSNTFANELSSAYSNSTDTFDKPMSGTRKNVSFNSAIDIRTYPKNVPKYTTTSKNINEFLYIEDKQLAVNFNDGTNSSKEKSNEEKLKATLLEKVQIDKTKNEKDLSENLIESLSKTLINGPNNSNTIPDELTNLINAFNFPKADENHIGSNNNTNDGKNNKNENIKNTDRCNISSKKKLPGETPVRDLEKSLKMIIIKELSVEKVDGTFLIYFFCSLQPLFLNLHDDSLTFVSPLTKVN